jgi:hypothetical protein
MTSPADISFFLWIFDIKKGIKKVPLTRGDFEDP